MRRALTRELSSLYGPNPSAKIEERLEDPRVPGVPHGNHAGLLPNRSQTHSLDFADKQFLSTKAAKVTEVDRTGFSPGLSFSLKMAGTKFSSPGFWASFREEQRYAVGAAGFILSPLRLSYVIAVLYLHHGALPVALCSQGVLELPQQKLHILLGSQSPHDADAKHLSCERAKATQNLDPLLVQKSSPHFGVIHTLRHRHRVQRPYSLSFRNMHAQPHVFHALKEEFMATPVPDETILQSLFHDCQQRFPQGIELEIGAVWW